MSILDVAFSDENLRKAWKRVRAKRTAQVEGVTGGNWEAWKTYRHDGLGPPIAAHLSCCQAYTEWLRQNIPEDLASAPIYGRAKSLARPGMVQSVA